MNIKYKISVNRNNSIFDPCKSEYVRVIQCYKLHSALCTLQHIWPLIQCSSRSLDDTLPFKVQFNALSNVHTLQIDLCDRCIENYPQRTHIALFIIHYILLATTIFSYKNALSTLSRTKTRSPSSTCSLLLHLRLDLCHGYIPLITVVHWY